MAENRIWFSTVQVAFILNTTDRTIRTRAKNHIQDSEMVLLKGKAYEFSDLFVSLYRKLSEVIGSDEVEENDIINEIKKEFDKGNRIEVFSPEDYVLFEKTLKDYQFKSNEIKHLDKTIIGLVQDKMFLQNQLEYHRKSLMSKERQMEMLLLAMTNKQFIEEDSDNK